MPVQNFDLQSIISNGSLLHVSHATSTSTEQVRYIIDYYHDASLPAQEQAPRQHDLNTRTQIELDVRPALDSPMALFDRIRRGSARTRHFACDADTANQHQITS